MPKPSTEQTGPKTGEGRDARGRFGAGNPGRPPGIKDTRTKGKEELLELFRVGDPAAGLKSQRDRLIALANSPDEGIRFRLEIEIFEQMYGKAKESVDVFHRFDAIDEAAEMMDEANVWQGRDVDPHRSGDDDDGRRAN